MAPAKWLMHWHPNPGATLNSQILAEACSFAESLGGTKDGRWKTSIISYRPITRDSMGAGGRLPPDVPGELLGVALHENPGLYFSILRGHRLVLQADAAFPHVMEKLQSYKARVSLNFEGFQYQLGDFCLRIGKCAPNNSETMRGIMMELKLLTGRREKLDDFLYTLLYGPACNSSVCEPSQASRETILGRVLSLIFHRKVQGNYGRLIGTWQETLAKKSLPGRFIHVESNFSEYGLSDHYSFQHTAVQYATCLQQLMAIVRA